MVIETIAAALDLVLTPITIFPMYISVLLVAALITVLIMGLNRLFINRTVIKEIKKRMEEIREQLTQAQKIGDKENTSKFLNELMKTNSQYMKHTFKTLIISLIVISLFLPWLSFKYEGLAVAQLPFALPIIGTSLTWLYWYILVSLSVGWLLRKLLGSEI